MCALTVVVLLSALQMLGVRNRQESNRRAKEIAEATRDPDDPVETTVADFAPADPGVDIGQCQSTYELPGCGSKDRGGPAQTLVFVVLVAAVGGIALRIFFAIRARDRARLADAGLAGNDDDASTTGTSAPPDADTLTDQEQR